MIYQKYTGVMSGVLQHLSSIKMLVPQEKITIKVPYIPGFNDSEDLDSDIEEIKRKFRFTKVYKFEYKIL